MGLIFLVFELITFLLASLKIKLNLNFNSIFLDLLFFISYHHDSLCLKSSSYLKILLNDLQVSFSIFFIILYFLWNIFIFARISFLISSLILIENLMFVLMEFLIYNFININLIFSAFYFYFVIIFTHFAL